MPATATPPPTLVNPADLIGLNDVADLLGVGVSLAHYHASRPSFPAPIKTVGRSRIWTRPAIEAWLEAWAASEEGRRALKRRA